MLPSAAALTQYVFVSKLSCGFRGVALYTSIYRTWARSRRALAREWGMRNLQPFFAAAPGRGHVGAAWMQAVDAETCPEDEEHAAVLAEMAHFFNLFSHRIMLREARLSFNVYRGPRVFVGRRLVLFMVFARRSVGVGGTFANT